MVPGFVLGLTVHEYCHALAAYRLGDDTAAQAGRLSLNPAKHLDLFGSLMLLLAGFGWAKPVPVNPANLRNPRTDMLWIALAGPFANLLIAFAVGTLIASFFSVTSPGALTGQSSLMAILVATVWINALLAVFNLLPIPPLDGSRILDTLVPRQWYGPYLTFRRLGPMIILGVVVISAVADVSLFGAVLVPVVDPIFRLCLGGEWQAF